LNTQQKAEAFDHLLDAIVKSSDDVKEEIKKRL